MDTAAAPDSSLQLVVDKRLFVRKGDKWPVPDAEPAVWFAALEAAVAAMDLQALPQNLDGSGMLPIAGLSEAHLRGLVEHQAGYRGMRARIHRPQIGSREERPMASRSWSLRRAFFRRLSRHSAGPELRSGPACALVRMRRVGIPASWLAGREPLPRWYSEVVLERR